MTASTAGRMPRGFTLIELLVVVAIIGLLIAITLPSLTKAKTQAKRTACASNLKQLAIAMNAYLQDSRDRMPYVSFMPSDGPYPLTTDKPIYLADVLKQQLKGQSTALECPDDRPGLTNRGAPNIGLSYFQSERSSYEYRYQLAGLTPLQLDQHSANFPDFHHGRPGHEQHHNSGDKEPPNTIWFARDYWNFHGKAGTIGARRYIYIDGHVGDFEN